MKTTDHDMIERMVEAIRFDVDYLCIEPRTAPAVTGTINRELYDRVTRAYNKRRPMFTQGMRSRVFATLNLQGTRENHALFTQAIGQFRERLNRFGSYMATPKYDSPYNHHDDVLYQHQNIDIFTNKEPMQ